MIFPSRFFYKAYFCKSERKSLEKGATGESQLSGSPVSFGSVLQAGGKCSKDNNPPDKRSTEEESTEESIVPTKEKETMNQTLEIKGVNIREEKHPSVLTDNETDAVPTDERPDPAEDENEKDITTNPKEKLNSQAQGQDDKGTIGAAQISEKATPSEEDRSRTSKRTETFDQHSTGSNGSDTESKKDK